MAETVTLNLSGGDQPPRPKPKPTKPTGGRLAMADPGIYETIFEAAGRAHNVDPELLKSIAKQESNFNPKAVGPQTDYGRAEGMMQILPKTAKGLGVTDTKDPKQAIFGAAKLLSQNLDQFGNVEDAIAAYHGGPNTKIWGPKTRKYREEVASAYLGGQSGGKPVDEWEMFASGQAAPKSAPQAPAAAAVAPSTAPSGQVDAWEAFASGGSPTGVATPPTPAAPTGPARKSQTLGLQAGVMKPLDRMAMGLEGLVDKGAVFMEDHTDKGAIARFLGMPTAREAAGVHSAKRASDEHDAFLAAQKAKGITPGGLGRFVGEMAVSAPAMALPGGPLIQGAGAGAMLSEGKNAKDVATDAAFGAAGGKLGDMLVGGASRVIKPKLRDAVSKLIGEGVSLTPGQIAGGIVKDVEDKATSIPFVGEMIKGAQRRSVESFNRAAVNRALQPAGITLPKDVPVGREAVAYAQDALSGAYDKLLPSLKVKVDPKFTKDVASLRSLAKNMPADQVKMFDNILKNEVLTRFAPKTGIMSGETMKEVESVLGKEIRDFSSSASPHDRRYADAMRELQSQIRGLVERSNPGKADVLKGINKGYANLVRVERAAAGNGAKEGIFTPAQLGNAVKGADTSTRKRAVASGKALMQDLTDAAQSVLPSKIPDSGTPGRLMMNTMLTGGGAAALHAMGVNPVQFAAMLTAAGAASAPYSKVGGKLVQGAMTARPKGAAQVAKAVSKLKTPAIMGGAALASGAGSQRTKTAPAP